MKKKLSQHVRRLPKALAFLPSNPHTRDMNIYLLTVEAHTDNYGRPVESYTYKYAIADKNLDYFLSVEDSKGFPTSVTGVWSESTDCAGCGHDWRDHFEGTGLCNLGFCATRCSEFVRTP